MCVRLSASGRCEALSPGPRERLAHYGLELYLNKTRFIEFGRFARANRRKKGQGKRETFGFLDITHLFEQTRK